MQCSECGTTVALPSSVKTVTCRRCGEVYFVNDGEEPRRFYPSFKMYPFEHDGIESKWMPTFTRPLRTGTYQCRFRNTEPNVIDLYWDGWCFRALGLRVRMTEFLTWRGMLA